jgi:hypothetical protein
MKDYKWTLTKTDMPCNCCGWDTTAVWHYRSAGGDIADATNHCSTCHKVGSHWARKGDSEPVSANLEAVKELF